MGGHWVYRAGPLGTSIRPPGHCAKPHHAHHSLCDHASSPVADCAPMTGLGNPTQPHQKLKTGWLALIALALIGLWQITEHLVPRKIAPQISEMIVAARTMQSAMSVLRAEKQARGLLQPIDIDINQTGMIGAEFTGITTTLGELPAKRTATNPDLAALIVKLLTQLSLPAGAPVVVVISGSFVGADVATLAALEVLDLRPILIASLSASMWGANDPNFNLLDILSLLRQRGIIKTKPFAAVIGGEGAIGAGMDKAGLAALHASAERENISLVDARPVSVMIDQLMAKVLQALPQGQKPAAVINVGGALIGLGTCRESYEMPPGLLPTPVCHDGTPGLVFRLAEQGIPMLNVLNMRRLAIEYGLPFDPVPLPVPGNNMAIYGQIRESPNEADARGKRQ
ncbi:MAG: poly-gamma-glutamate system protein [Alphaproteobacteria bacterium]|nr:poly-gamma-glutamate system protein [Alphaproteobacteria bacterium]